MNHGLVAAAVAALVTGTVHAGNLGVAGRTYSIVESDFRAVVGQQLERAMTPEFLKKKKEGALDNFIKRLPDFGFTVRTKAVTKEVDVRQTLARDIWAPQLGADGKIKHTLVARKGDKLDPFANGIVPNTSFLIIDGNNPRQVELAKQVSAWSPLVYIVLGKGDPRELAAQINRPVDYVRPEMVELFQLKHVPSFVWAEKRGKSGVLQVFEMAEPLVLADVQSKWKPSVTGTAGLKQYQENQDEIRAKGIGSNLGSSGSAPRK